MNRSVFSFFNLVLFSFRRGRRGFFDEGDLLWKTHGPETSSEMMLRYNRFFLFACIYASFMYTLEVAYIACLRTIADNPTFYHFIDDVSNNFIKMRLIESHSLHLTKTDLSDNHNDLIEVFSYKTQRDCLFQNIIKR